LALVCTFCVITGGPIGLTAAGWAGYTLARALDATKYQAVVISPRSYFVFTPLLAATSVGTLEFRTALEPVRSKRTKVAYYQGWADSVDFRDKTVTVEEAVDDPNQGIAPLTDRHEGETLAQREQQRALEAKIGHLFNVKYDKLVIAVGCYSQTFGIPGVKEHALFLKDVGDARKIRNRLLACETVTRTFSPDFTAKTRKVLRLRLCRLLQTI
jgi:NADH dehydrogenase FAD-containing subunit